MNAIQHIFQALDEREIARQIGLRHDEARMQYRLESNTVGSYSEFMDIIADYYNWHFSKCNAPGGGMDLTQAEGRAKQLIEQQDRRQRGDIVSAFNDAHQGTNGGLRVILDFMSEGLKEEATQFYVSNVFDQWVTPNEWDQKVEIIRQFMERFSAGISEDIRRDQPERYAQNYAELIQAYVDGLRQTSSVFRRL